MSAVVSRRGIFWERRSSRNSGWLLFRLSVLIPLIGLLLFFIYPLATVVWHSLRLDDGSYGFGNYAMALQSPGLIKAIIHSLVLGVSTTVVGLVLGFILAYTLERSALRGKSLIRGSLMLPLLAPSLVQGMGLLFLFGRSGVIARLTGWDIDIYGFWGLLISDLFWCLPQAVMILQAALRNADVRYYDAAEVMGASGWRQFFDITLPSAKFGLLSAGFVIFALTITDFGNAFVIGGSYNVLAMEIYTQVTGQLDFSVGSVIGVFLLLPTLISLYIQRVFSQRGGSSETLIPMMPRRVPERDWFLRIICWATVAVIVAVVAIVIYASFVKLWPYNLNFTLENYSFSDVHSGLRSLWTSLEASVLVALGGTVTLFMLAFGLKHITGPLGKITYLFAVMPVGAPGLVLGLSYIFAFNVPNSPLYILYGTVAVIALCNFYHYHSQSFLTMMTGMRSVPDNLEDVVACLGGRVRNVLRDAVLPFMVPTVISVFFYLFMRSMVTLSAVIFLITATLNLASVTVMSLEHDGFMTEAASFSTLIMLLVTTAMLLMRLVTGFLSRRIGIVGQA